LDRRAARTKDRDGAPATKATARARELLGVAAPEPPRKKSLAEWVWLLLGIDVNRCPRCGAAGLQRTKVLPMCQPAEELPALTQRPPLEDTS
jgi:hypothetical protein